MQAMIKKLTALITCHWLAMLGFGLTTGSGVALITLSLLRYTNPYYGILLFLVLPSFFAVGLLLIPAGLYLRSRQVGGLRKIWVDFSWEDTTIQRLVLLLTAATVLNVVLLSTAAYGGREYLDSDAFCGTVCHDVMGPQYTRYLESSHARAGCVSCHIAPGVSWTIYHKLDGVRQVLARASGSYATPIPSEGGRIHAASETCGRCHPTDVGSYMGETLRVIRSFAQDASSTPRFTVLVMHAERIHRAHLEDAIEFVAEDGTLQSIPWVSGPGGEYLSGSRPAGPSETMDCIDCHNRVGHDFPTIEDAVDRALLEGVLDSAVPFAKREAMTALENEPPADASQPVRNIYADHVFPEMNVGWDTYPDNGGHQESPGCFRCHDADHQNASGDSLFLGCTTCHSLTAIQEEAPDILPRLGL